MNDLAPAEKLSPSALQEEGAGKRERPCLNHHIHRCLGPCCGLVYRQKYRAMIREVCLFLEGRQEDLVRQLTARMEEAAEKLDFEQAARLRDQIRAVGEVVEKQKIISGGFEDQDVAALAETFDEACVMLFLIRGGKLIGREHFTLKGTEGLSRSEIITAFVKQYYNDAELIPGEILISEDTGEEKPVIEAWLSGKRGAKVALKTPGAAKRKAGGNGGPQCPPAWSRSAEKAAERDEIAGALAELARGWTGAASGAGMLRHLQYPGGRERASMVV